MTYLVLKRMEGFPGENLNIIRAKKSARAKTESSWKIMRFFAGKRPSTIAPGRLKTGQNLTTRWSESDQFVKFAHEINDFSLVKF
ncbi:MAG: hypothetical protein J6Y80_02200 [Victivallales bacterium]|nr:hypothetical protein [Victivallales bacterium]